MPKPFKLIEKHFSEKYQEWQRTYELKIVFNKNQIIAITITDHYQQKPGREWITNELILEVIENRFHNKKSEPIDYPGARKVFKRETTYQNKRYRFFF